MITLLSVIFRVQKIIIIPVVNVFSTRNNKKKTNNVSFNSFSNKYFLVSRGRDPLEMTDNLPTLVAINKELGNSFDNIIDRCKAYQTVLLKKQLEVTEKVTKIYTTNRCNHTSVNVDTVLSIQTTFSKVFEIPFEYIVANKTYKN